MPNKQITDEMVEAGAKALGGDDWITCVHDRPMWRREAKEVLEAAARVRAENDAFRDAVVTGLGAVKMNADGTTERVDLRAEANAGKPEQSGMRRLTEAQAYIDGTVVARIIMNFHSEFREVYPEDVLTSSLCAVGPLQSMIGLAIKNGLLSVPKQADRAALNKENQNDE